MKAVITADIIDYTKLSENEANQVLNTLHKVFNEMNSLQNNINNDFHIKRGDSIQGVTNKPEQSLRLALLLKTGVNKIDFDNKKRGLPKVDLRIAIGIGNTNLNRENINESSGDAFTFSGRVLDEMKKHKRLIKIKTINSDFNDEIETELKLLEIIMDSWKITSSEVLYWTLLDYNEKRIAEKLKISQPAVNQRKKSAGWSGIEALLNRYENKIKIEQWI